MLEALFKYNFVQNAVLTAVFSSIVCGIIGTIIVEKRLVSMSGGIAHASFGGIGLGYLLNIEPIVPGLIFSVFSSLSIAKINRRSSTNSDTLIGMFWAIGMALGILFISMAPGYQPDMTSYLFGDILTVSRLYLYLILGLSAFVFVSVLAFFDYLRSYMFDEEYLSVIGVDVVKLENFIFILISLSIVILIKVVGIILSIALLTIPPATAKLYTKNLKNMMLLSSIFGMLFNITGLIISYYLNIPSGATIILLSSAIYFIAGYLKGKKLIFSKA
jgi:zinc transport system permease protein